MDYDPDYWPPYTVKIVIDANNGDMIYYVIHELLHVVFSPLIAPHMDETLEELVIVSFDTYVADWIKGSKVRRAKWERLIEKKIAESEAKKNPLPLAERVDRS